MQVRALLLLERGWGGWHCRAPRLQLQLVTSSFVQRPEQPASTKACRRNCLAQVALMQQIVGDPGAPAALALPEALLAQLAGSPGSLQLLLQLRQLAAARQAEGAGGRGASPFACHGVKPAEGRPGCPQIATHPRRSAWQQPSEALLPPPPPSPRPPCRRRHSP
jgi:hypothetical protein